ncbi:MAG: SBBP repeat-containing protein [Planctomycetota bacterium]
MRRCMCAGILMGFVALAATQARAGSLYLVGEHHWAQFEAWNINPDGSVTRQYYDTLFASDPAGIGVDSDSASLFITSEFSPGIEVWDARQMKWAGWADGPDDLAGIDVDDANDIVYTMLRGSGVLYAYDWDPAMLTLTLRPGYPISLPNCVGAFGIGLDEIAGKLYVADGFGSKVSVYDTTTWSEIGTFVPSVPPVGLAVDRRRGFVYTTAPSGECAFGPYGYNLLSQWNVATGTEATVDMGHGGMGIAVDEITGYVFVTGGCDGDDLSVWDTSLSLLYTSGRIGNPAGIATGNPPVSYNPLDLAKSHGLAEGECVIAGDQLTYDICYDNLENSFDVHNVIIMDNLPPDGVFVWASDGGVYDPTAHTVAWNIGSVPAGTPQRCLQLVVRIDPGTPPETVLVNFATIVSDETPPTTVSRETSVCTDAPQQHPRERRWHPRNQGWVARYDGPTDGDDGTYGIALDDAGNVYVAGYSWGANNYDFVTIKYDGDGEKLWVARYNSGTLRDDIAARWPLGLDSAGNVYVTGRSWTPTRGFEYTTVKHDNDGQYQWIKTYSGAANGDDEPFALVVDVADNIYVTGKSWNGANFDYATVKYRSDGTEEWVAIYNGPANLDDRALGIAVDASGYVYVTGESWFDGTNSNFATIKYRSDGAQLWVAPYSGAGNFWDEPGAIAVDSAGRVYVTGSSWDSHDWDYVTLQYDANGHELWRRYYNGEVDSWDNAHQLRLDQAAVYVTGTSWSGPNWDDYVTVKYDQESGTELWVRRYDGRRHGGDYVTDLVRDQDGRVYVTGQGCMGPASGYDFATVKYESEGTECGAFGYSGPGLGLDCAIAIAVDRAGNVYVTGESWNGVNLDCATVKYCTDGMSCSLR